MNGWVGLACLQLCLPPAAFMYAILYLVSVLKFHEIYCVNLSFNSSSNGVYVGGPVSRF